MTEPATSKIIYRGMNRAELDAAYNNTAAVADSAKWVVRWRQRSDETRRRSDLTLGAPYGKREREIFDYFPSGKPKAPLFVFIHGGYWVRNSIDLFSFLAEGPNAQGIDFAALGYTLAPEARLDQIVDEIQRGLTHLQTASEFSYDPEKIYVGGWSAGGHLAAITANHPAVRGILPISGIFDLEPLSLNYLNEPMQFTAEDIRTLSPLHRLKDGLPPAHLLVGGGELHELQRQSRDYTHAAKEAGHDIQLSVVGSHHHYSILDELAKPDGIATKALQALVAGRAARA